MKPIIVKIEEDLRRITNQNVKCEPNQHTVIIILEHKLTEEVQSAINAYIYKNVPCGLGTVIKIKEPPTTNKPVKEIEKMIKHYEQKRNDCELKIESILKEIRDKMQYKSYVIDLPTEAQEAYQEERIYDAKVEALKEALSVTETIEGMFKDNVYAELNKLIDDLEFEKGVANETAVSAMKLKDSNGINNNHYMSLTRLQCKEQSVADTLSYVCTKLYSIMRKIGVEDNE